MNNATYNGAPGEAATARAAETLAANLAAARGDYSLLRALYATRAEPFGCGKVGAPRYSKPPANPGAAVR